MLVERSRMMAGARTIGHLIAKAALAVGAVVVVCVVTGLALIFTLVCAAPHVRDQA